MWLTGLKWLIEMDVWVLMIECACLFEVVDRNRPNLLLFLFLFLFLFFVCHVDEVIKCNKQG